eukprot:TRINITY_DN2389_c0_g1_i1.p2 TRINITY_DN2389_c0_g1~~TRINITY_DN2389_c0_g1_i1.p2  ORF type:complete len:197 (-),score=38.27 TRINITY_DN2389_c0_g1_i1:17-607(-)
MKTLLLFVFVVVMGVLLEGPVACVAQCIPTNTTGCLNGNAYNYSTQFPCRDHFYQDGVQGCCAEGLVFNTSTSFCCNDGIHDWDQYHCVLNPNKQATETGSSRQQEEEEEEEIRFYLAQNGTECQTATKEYGCLNGVEYDWETQYPCGSYLLLYATQGCCQGVPYSLSQQTCCFDKSSATNYLVFNRPDACNAELY